MQKNTLSPRNITGIYIMIISRTSRSSIARSRKTALVYKPGFFVLLSELFIVSRQLFQFEGYFSSRYDGSCHKTKERKTKGERGPFLDTDDSSTSDSDSASDTDTNSESQADSIRARQRAAASSLENSKNCFSTTVKMELDDENGLPAEDGPGPSTQANWERRLQDEMEGKEKHRVILTDGWSFRSG